MRVSAGIVAAARALDKLRPENGPFGAALGTWLDFAPSGLSTRFLLLWFVILYTAFQVISNAPLGISPNLLEIYAKGLHPAAGYDAHPPLEALMAGMWFTVFPTNDWAFHLFAIGNGALALFAIDRIAQTYLQGDKRILVLLLLLLTPFYQFYVERNGAHLALLWTWPLATFFFLRSFATFALVWAAAAGAVAALAMLGSYYSIFLIAGFVAAVAASPSRLAYLRSPAPWISVIAGGAVLGPYLQWLYANGFAPLAEAASADTGAALGEVLGHDAIYLLAAVGYVAAPIAVYGLAARPGIAALRATLWPPDKDGRMLIVLLAVPLLLPAIVAPFIGIALTPLHALPAWFLLPIVLLRPPAAKLTRVAAIRITTIVVAITIGALVASPWLAWRSFRDGTKEGREYYRLIAPEITNNWHLAMGLPLRIVMGDPFLAAATTFYSTDHPDSVPSFSLAAAPWVTPERLENEGWVAICNADDQACTDEARRRAADRNDIQVVTFSTLARYLGRTGKLGRFLFVLIPPNRIRIVPR